MKISTTQENLAKGLLITSRVSSKTVNLPILQNVLIKADEKVLRLSSTNLEIAVSSLVRGKVEENGEFTVPAKLLADYVFLLPNEKIDLELEGNILKVISGKTETKIQGIQATEFPVIPTVADGKKYIVKIKKLHEAINKVVFAVAQNEARPELTGVLFSFHHPVGEKNTLTLTTTDSYRLAETTIVLEEQSSPDQSSLIIPAKTLNEVARVLSVEENMIDAPETMNVIITENQVQFEIGNTELQSRIIEGNYPDYRQIIPAQFKTEATLSRQEFMSVIKAASLFTKPGLYDVKLEFETGKQMVVGAANAQTGDYHTEVASEIKGNGNFVVLNYKYLLDGLNAIEEDEIFFKLIDAANPCLLLPKSEEEKYRYIIMPIRQ